MTLLSENDEVAIVVSNPPAERMHKEWDGERAVSRLSFLPLETSIPQILIVESGMDSDDKSVLLHKEIATLNMRLEEQAQQMAMRLEKVGNETREEARLSWAEEMEAKIAAEQMAVRKACEEFDRERAGYFADVEAEVVKLALSIAAHILHREVKLDPLLLAGVVKVALERIEEGSAIVLRVPVGQTEMWQSIFAVDSPAQIVEDERLSAGECVLETSVGRAELGVAAQLSEIERGFFDLLQQRPLR